MSAITIPIGTFTAGGYFAGSLVINDIISALIVSPKTSGDIAETPWHTSTDRISDALSFCDGLANTNAMAAVGSPLALQIRALRINGFDDWHLPAQDQLELIYRHLKPGPSKNWQYNRSGINVSALPATYPYTADLPVQTSAPEFCEGGTEALELTEYWTSTQHAAASDWAWCQDFSDGSQGSSHKDLRFRARAVRTIPLSDLVAG